MKWSAENLRKELLIPPLIVGLFIFFVIPSKTSALNQTGSSAIGVIGQDGFDACNNKPNGLDPAVKTGGVLDTVVIGEKFVVADMNNNRVLIYDSIPTSNGEIPSVVIGQPDFCHTDRNYNGVSASTLYQPYSVSTDGVKLFIADTNNSRILIYNSLPTENFAPADIVIGQADFISGNANRGGSVNANTLYRPSNVFFEGEKLFIADRYNHRVLIFNSVPEGNGASANLVLGQTLMTTSTANNGGRSASSLSEPYAVFYDGANLFVSERGNNRVMIWTEFPAVNKDPADVVIGQPNFTTGGQNQGGLDAGSISYANEAFSDGTHLLISDYQNHRVLVFDSIPTTNNENADYVIGQADFATSTANQGGAPGANTLYSPHGIYMHAGALFISDFDNRRVLRLNKIPHSNNDSADVVIGKDALTETAYSTNAYGYVTPSDILIYGGMMFVVDAGNNRVLIYHNVPDSMSNAPDIILGQTDFISAIANSGGLSASSMSSPVGVAYDGTRLFVSDGDNHRVLIWNHLPTENFEPADIVVGQPNMTSNTANNGGRSASTLYYPAGIFSDGEKLFIADSGNHRVIVFDTVPVANGTGADRVIGQAAWNGGTGNRGGSVGSNTLYSPYSLSYDGNDLWVADSSNNRILLYDDINSFGEFGATATLAVGQANLSSGLANQGGSIEANTLSRPRFFTSDGTRLFISDWYNSRVLIYNSLPTSNNASADVVIGQTDMLSGLANQGNDPSGSTLYYPEGISFDSNNLYIADWYNNRILAYSLGPRDTGLTSSTSFTTEREITLTIDASDAKEMMVSENMNFSDTTWESYSGTKPWVLSEENGVKTVYAKIRDYGNYEGEVLSVNIYFDTTSPTGSISIYEGERTNSRYVHLSLTVDDNLTINENIEMMLSEDPAFNGASWEAYSASKIFTLSSINGNRTIHIKYRDETGNESETYSDTILLDDVQPTGGIEICPDGVDNCADILESINHKVVEIKLRAEDNIDPNEDIETLVSEDPAFSGSSWEIYTLTMDWTLSTGDGIKTIYVKYRDESGNESEIYSDTIILDTTAPDDALIENLGKINLLEEDQHVQELRYYFTSETAKIKGCALEASKVIFVVGGVTYETNVGEDCKYEITLVVEKGDVIINYYTIDSIGNRSEGKILGLIVGCENFPEGVFDEYCGVVQEEEKETEGEGEDTTSEEAEKDEEKEEEKESETEEEGTGEKTEEKPKEVTETKTLIDVLRDNKGLILSVAGMSIILLLLVKRKKK